MKIIGLTGAAGCGKDTVGAMLRDTFGYATMSFAAPLKRMLNVVLNSTMADWEDREWKERVHPAFGKSPRYLAQTLGTEWGRELIRDDIWPSLAIQAAEYGRIKKLVFTDCRFENEAALVRERGGMMIHITRPNSDIEIDNQAHSSEGGIKVVPGDFHILNDGTLDELKWDVSVAATLYAGRKYR